MEALRLLQAGLAAFKPQDLRMVRQTGLLHFLAEAHRQGVIRQPGRGGDHGAKTALFGQIAALRQHFHRGA
ncbi:hypothetical protein D3C77_791990 [compost metagenome]